jgi:predicted transposase YbfD/YdcC
VLGQLKVADNEIVAIPALLNMLVIEGAIVTMGCQRSIAQKILDKKADYITAWCGSG